LTNDERRQKARDLLDRAIDLDIVEELSEELDELIIMSGGTVGEDSDAPEALPRVTFECEPIGGELTAFDSYRIVDGSEAQN
jgi:hypothetical protein